jgi:hypothetical protein
VRGAVGSGISARTPNEKKTDTARLKTPSLIARNLCIKMTFPDYVQPGELTPKPADISHARFTRKNKQMKAAFQCPNFDSFYDSESGLMVALSPVYRKAPNYTGY